MGEHYGYGGGKLRFCALGCTPFASPLVLSIDSTRAKEERTMADEQKLSEEQRELVAVGASVGAGCHPCVSYHVKAGAKAGLSGDRLLAAVTSAERVAAEAAERMAAHARSQLGV